MQVSFSAKDIHELFVEWGASKPQALPHALDDPFEAELDFDGFNDLVTNAQSLRIAYSTPAIRATSITAHRFSS